jgi:hypothetical protein
MRNEINIIYHVFKENPNRFAITSKDTPQRVMFDGQIILGLSDYAGAYNRIQLIEKDLYFNWGCVEDLKMSDRTRELIECRRFSKMDFGQIEWLDGSELITLEIFANSSPDVIAQYNYNANLIHPWSLIRPLISSIKTKRTIKMPFKEVDFYGNVQSWALMSWISCFHFDVEQNNIFLPWLLFSKKSGYSFDDIKELELFQIMSKYEKPKNVIGLSNMGIKKIEFSDTEETKSEPVKYF